jgi:hypothetical protein
MEIGTLSVKHTEYFNFYTKYKINIIQMAIGIEKCERIKTLRK